MAETVKIILDSTDELYSIPEIAKKMKTTKGVIYQLLDAGLLPSIRVGRYRRIRKFRFNEFLAKYEGQDLINVWRHRKRADTRF